MKVDKELIMHVAATARLNLTEEEIETFVPQFREILKNFSVLDEIDVTSVKMSMQPVEIRNVLREDKIKECFSQDEALSQARNHKKDGYFKGPKAV